jgi:predicted adenylyl cyclase CyaB
MPSNIEIKAILRDRAAAESIAAGLSNGKPLILQQIDVFFQSPDGRLKLRILKPDSGELIRYERANLPEVRLSHYAIARTPDPEILLDILTKTLGQAGIVKKTRHLYLVGQTRVHIDAVEELGDFLELEVVLRPGQSETEGRQIALELLAKFSIEKSDLLADAYVDLIEARRQSFSPARVPSLNSSRPLAVRNPPFP